MLPLRPASEGPFARSVRESLESAIAPNAAQHVIADALARASLEAVPEEIGAFRAFCEGPFRKTIRAALGGPSIEQVFERLGHVLWMATSDFTALEAARAWSRGTGENAMPPADLVSSDGMGEKAEDSGVRHVDPMPPLVTSAAKDAPKETDSSTGMRRPAITVPSPEPVASPPQAEPRRQPTAMTLGRMRAPTLTKMPATPGSRPGADVGPVRAELNRHSSPGSGIDRHDVPPAPRSGVNAVPPGVAQVPGVAGARFTPLPPTPTPVRRSSSPPSPARVPTFVLVVSLDEQLVTDMRGELGGQCPVRSIGTPTELAGALAKAGERLVVLIDTALPSIDVPTFAGIAPILPPGARVVLWGASSRQQQRLATLYPHAVGWVASDVATRPGRFVLDLP